MPWKWVENEPFVVRAGVVVRHTYTSCFAQEPSPIYYELVLESQQTVHVDIRCLPVPAWAEHVQLATGDKRLHAYQLERAIDAGYLTKNGIDGERWPALELLCGLSREVPSDFMSAGTLAGLLAARIACQGRTAEALDGLLQDAYDHARTTANNGGVEAQISALIGLHGVGAVSLIMDVVAKTDEGRRMEPPAVA